MSLSNRRTVLGLLGALPLAACGFTPVYREGTGARSLRDAVLVDAPKDRADFDLVRAVEDRLGRPSAARYGLSVAQSVAQTALAVQGSAAITRYNLIGSASYTLRDLGTNALVVSGNVDSFTSYSATASTVGTSSAEVDARRRLSVALGDLIVSQLLIDVPETQL